MKCLLLFLCFAAAEKLDRTYLPPPGAKFSGGAPGDIQAPFEFPKETYSTTLRPDIYNNGAITPEDSRIEVGINRGIPLRPGASEDVFPGSQAPDYRTYKLPTTTTSYAFTTTTTHPPSEAYETTVGPINPVTGLPSTTLDYPTSAPGFLNPAIYSPENLPGTFQQNQVPSRIPFGSPTQYPATTTFAPGAPIIGQNRPGFIQGSNVVSNQRPGVISGSVQRPNTPPSDKQIQYQGNQYPVNTPEVGPQNSSPSAFPSSTFATTTFAPGTFAPTTFAPGTTPSSIQYGGDLDQSVVSNQNVPFSQGNIPEGPFSGVQVPYYPSQNQPQYVTPGQQLPQGVLQQPGQVQYETNKEGVSPQQYPISQTDEFGRPVQNYLNKPFSTASQTTPVPSLGQFSSSTPGTGPSATSVYQSSSFPTTSGIIGNQGIETGLITRPERPQAEADRNAVILNYENVITPEGFAYSFDTSNGIHADESGTAVDGVKAKGSYSYIGDDGKLYSIVYTADENGFQPRGDHLPTSPPIPEAILKVIEQAKKDQEAGVSDDGTYDEDKYGHMKYEGVRYKPQQPKRINGKDKTPNRYDGQYDQTDRRQQLTPKEGTERPVSSNQDYEDIGDKQGQVDDKVINYNQRPSSDQKPSRKPFNRIPEGNSGQYNPKIDSGEGSGNGLSDEKISSQYPIPGSTGDRRQFSESNDDRFKFEQGNALDENRPGSKVTQDIYNAGDSRRPFDSQSNQGSKDISDYTEGSDRRPQYNNERPPADTVNDYNRPGSKTSSQRPAKYPNESRVTSVPGSLLGNYGNRIRPASSTAKPGDETGIYNYQDSRRPSNLDKYLPNKGYTDQPVSSSTTLAPTSNQYSGSADDNKKSQRIENVSEQNYRPTYNRLPSKISGSLEYDSTGSQIPVSRNPGTDDVTSDQYSSNRGRPQSSPAAVSQQEKDYYSNRVTEPAIIQNIKRPLPGRRPSETNRYPTITPTEEEGYQYLPPQRMFNQESRRPGSSQLITSNEKPSQNRPYNKGKVPKPFITPDASRFEEGTEDDYEKFQDNNQYGKPQYNQFQPSQRPASSQQSYQKYDNEISSERYDKIPPQKPGFEQTGGYGTKLDAARIPDEGGKVTTIGPTRRPPYQQIQTTRPQQKYRPDSGYETAQGVPSGTVRPQEGNIYATSTPVPSQSTRFDVTQPSNFNPEQQSTDRYIGKGQTPSTEAYFTKTTEQPVRPTQNVYEQTPSQSPYQTTYRPMVTYSGGSSEAPSTTMRPGRPFGRPEYSQKQVPSTTYRPAYYPGQVTENSVTVDKFGRLLPQQPIEGDNRLGTSVTPEIISPSIQDSRRPVQGFGPVDMYERPKSPVQGNVPSYARPEGSSTTEKIIGEDFSGPKQQQNFDPERGYYY